MYELYLLGKREFRIVKVVFVFVFVEWQNNDNCKGRNDKKSSSSN